VEESVLGRADHRDPEGGRAGAPGDEVCRKHGISRQTIYRWKAKYDGMDVSEARRLRQIEDENRRLKQMVADQARDTQALKAVLQEQW
jgi:putative transposase